MNFQTDSFFTVPKRVFVNISPKMWSVPSSKRMASVILHSIQQILEFWKIAIDIYRYTIVLECNTNCRDYSIRIYNKTARIAKTRTKTILDPFLLTITGSLARGDGPVILPSTVEGAQYWLQVPWHHGCLGVLNKPIISWWTKYISTAIFVDTSHVTSSLLVALSRMR